MIILHKATVVTAEKEAVGTIVVDNGRITDVYYSDSEDFDYRIDKLFRAHPEAGILYLQGIDHSEQQA